MQTDLNNWVAYHLGADKITLSDLAGDASFKHFYRFRYLDKSYVVMTAPPDKEKVAEFYQVAKLLAEKGLTGPDIMACDLSLGYFLLKDLGDTLYLPVLQNNKNNNNNSSNLYRQALRALIVLQSGDKPDLPVFDKNMMQRECRLLTEWCLGELLGLDLTVEENKILDQTFNLLIDSAIRQPQVLVHRDYHSRNLFVMEQADQTPGIIDFQDAVIGPITYDLVSLLKDCYITWPEKQTRSLIEDFYLSLVANQQVPANQFDLFIKWYDWMGLQRHLKVLGIFARLHLRDDKSDYLNDTPRVMQYICEAVARYPELKDLNDWLHAVLVPAFILFWNKQGITAVDFTLGACGTTHDTRLQVA
jgi:aminoglycoside/choline kinase family phosphotransferase